MKIKPTMMLLAMLAGWINRQQQEAINYLKEENKILKHELLKATVAVRLRFISLLIAIINRLFTNTCNTGASICRSEGCAFESRRVG